jgi:hypothetical protein
MSSSDSTTRNCPNCSKHIKGHPNKKFCNSRFKDQYHNRTNSRGYDARGEWDRYADTIHPFSSEAFEE